MLNTLIQLISISFMYSIHVNMVTVDVAICLEEYDLPVFDVIKLALKEHNFSSIQIGNVDLIIADNNLRREQILKLLFKNETQPTILIDNTLKHKSNEFFSNRLKHLVREIGLPTLSIGKSIGRPGKINEQWKYLDSKEQKYLIQISQPTDIIPTVITDFFKHFKINLIVLLYDDQFDLKSNYQFYFKEFKGIYFFRKITFNNYELHLEELNKYKEGYFFVLTSLDMANNVLKKINKLKLMTIKRNWYFITKNLGKLECEECNDGFVHLMQPLKTKYKIYEHNCSMRTFNKLSKIDAYYYYDLTRFILSSLSSISNEMMENNFNIDLNLKYLIDKESKTDYEIKKRNYFDLTKQMYLDDFVGHYGRFVVVKGPNKIAFQEITLKLTKLQFKQLSTSNKISDNSNQSSTIANKETIENYNAFKIGEWIHEEKNGIFIWMANLKKHIKNHYIVVAIVQPPFLMKKINKNNVEWYGYCIDLIEEIKQEMNQSWTYEIYEVPDGKYGKKDLITQKWNGIIGELVKKFADIGIGPISVMAERDNVVDFTIPYYNLVGISILMKKTASRSHLFKFLTVLDNEFWLYTFISYIVVSISLWLFDKLSMFSYSNTKYKDQKKRRKFNFKECLWFCMTSITPQGGGEVPKNLSSRFLVATWWIFGFIIISFYTSNLAAFLTVSRLDSPIESLNHLVEQYRVKYAVQVNTEALTYFERMAHIERKFYEIWKELNLDENAMISPRERARLAVWDYPIENKYAKILKQMHITGLPKTFDEAVRRVKRSKPSQEEFAFLGDAIQIKYATLINCDLKQVGTEFSRKPLAIAVSENSTLKEHFSSAILKLLNKRKLESMKDKWWDEKIKRKDDCGYEKKLNDGISFNNIGGIFVIIFIGIILAILTLFLEEFKKKIKLNIIRSFDNNNKNLESNKLNEMHPIYYRNNLVSTINLANHNHDFYNLSKRTKFK